MITKAELQEQLNQANGRLKLIYECFPHLEQIDEHLSILKTMGLKEWTVKDVLKGESSYALDTICNPEDNEEYAIHMVRVEIHLDAITGKGEIRLDGKPYSEFFKGPVMKKSRLEKLSKENPEFKALYQENQELRMHLGR